MPLKDINSLGQIVGEALPNWEGAFKPDGRQLVGRQCHLECLNISKHGSGLFHAFKSDTEHRNWTYLPYGPFENEDGFCTYFRQFEGSLDPFFYVVIRKSDDAVIGLASYLRITPKMGSIEVGHIHFSPLLQRSSLATESMYLMMKHIFEDLGYRRYEWKCNNLNDASKKAALRLGFTPEGVFRQAGVYKGHNRDTAWFSILDKEWHAAKVGFEQWLLPSNFDERGNQLSKLQTK